MLNHASLFSGIGAPELAAEWMGWNNVFHCEWEDFPRRVLEYYWPNSISYGDITKTDFTIHRGTVDILTGGFPCQPYSAAGKRLGKADSRHLWPEMLRSIREIQPRWVVGENVSGLINWSKGLVFDEVQADLESAGYTVIPFVLPACGVNAPHRRDRIWFVAYSDNTGAGERLRDNGEREEENKGREGQPRPEFGEISGASPDTDINERCKGGLHQAGRETSKRHIGSFNTWPDWRAWQNFPTQPPVCSRNDGFSARLDGITFPKWRNESIKAYGNAMVPQVIYQIFKAIEQYETNA